MTRKALSILASFLIIVSISLSGCATGTTAPSPAANTAEPTASVQPAGTGETKVQYPLTTDKVTFSAFVNTRPCTDDFVNNEATKFLEEKTNIHLEFVSALEDEAQQKISLLLSTGDYPDLILSCPFSMGEMNLYASQGLFLPVDDYIDKYGGNINDVFAQYPDARVYMTLPCDGKLHCMPTVNDAFHCGDVNKMWYYKPTLDKLGLKPPTTTDELHNTLMAIKQQNPNQEPPAAGCANGWGTGADTFLCNAFVYNDGGDRIWIDNGKVSVTYTTPEYKESMKFIRKLVQDGLLAKETFTQDGSALIQMAEAEPSTVAFSFGGYEGCFQDMSNSKRWIDWYVNPALKGPNGVQLAPYDSAYAYGNGSVITDKCKNPDLAYKFLDSLYDIDIMMMVQYGTEGVDWRWANADEKGFAGPGVMVQLRMLDKAPRNIVWEQIGNLFWSNDFRIGLVTDVKENPMEKILYEGTRDGLKPYYPSVDHLWRSSIIPTTDEQQEISTIKSPLNQYVNEMVARFCTGDVDIDSGWDAYIQQLKSLNLDRYLELLQKVYDRQYK